MTVRPPRLRPGAAVSLVAPSGPFDREPFERGLEALSALGLVPRFDDRLFDRTGYLAGPDEQRLVLLEAALFDPETEAVWCVRGGYGALRLLARLRLRPLLARPKLLVGFSDVTALHAALNARGLGTLHGPVVTQLGTQPQEALVRLRGLLFDPAPPPPLTAMPKTTLVPGVARGQLFGGNLTVLASLAGSPFLPSLAGAILLVEDVAERPYRLDRMVTQLGLAGALDGLRGLAVGDLIRCDEVPREGVSPQPGALEVMGRLARELGVPAAAGFRIGHGDLNLAVPLSARVTLDADRGLLSFEEGAVA